MNTFDCHEPAARRLALLIGTDLKVFMSHNRQRVGIPSPPQLTTTRSPQRPLPLIRCSERGTHIGERRRVRVGHSAVRRLRSSLRRVLSLPLVGLEVVQHLFVTSQRVRVCAGQVPWGEGMCARGCSASFTCLSWSTFRLSERFSALRLLHSFMS